MSNLHSANTLFASRDDAEKALRALARADGKGERARVDFLEQATQAYLEGSLEPRIRSTKKGKQIDPVDGDYAYNAWAIYNDERAKTLSSTTGGIVPVRPVKDSRASELSQCFRAASVRADIIPATRRIVNEMVANGVTIPGTLNKDGEEQEFKGKTYDSIIKIARAQVAMAKDHGNVPMSDDEIEAALLERKTVEHTIEGDLEDLIKRAETVMDRHPSHADVVKVLVEGLRVGLATIVENKARAEKRAAYEAMRAEFEAEEAARSAASSTIDGDFVELTPRILPDLRVA